MSLLDRVKALLSTDKETVFTEHIDATPAQQIPKDEGDPGEPAAKEDA